MTRRCSPAAGADELLLEAGNERARTQHDVDVAARAALEGHAVELAGEVEGQLVAGLGLGALGARLELLNAVGEILERRVDVVVANLGDRALQRDVVERADVEFRQRLESDGEGEVALGRERALDLILPAGEIEFRLDRDSQRIFLDDLAVGLVDGFLKHVAHDALAIELLEMADRSLAGAEALDLGLGLHFGELGRELGREIAGRQHDLIFLLQPLR